MLFTAVWSRVDFRCSRLTQQKVRESTANARVSIYTYKHRILHVYASLQTHYICSHLHCHPSTRADSNFVSQARAAAERQTRPCRTAAAAHGRKPHEGAESEDSPLFIAQTPKKAKRKAMPKMPHSLDSDEELQRPTCWTKLWGNVDDLREHEENDPYCRQWREWQERQQEQQGAAKDPPPSAAVKDPPPSAAAAGPAASAVRREPRDKNAERKSKKADKTKEKGAKPAPSPSPRPRGRTRTRRRGPSTSSADGETRGLKVSRVGTHSVVLTFS